MPKQVHVPVAPPECPREPLGASPAILAKRNPVKQHVWCPIRDIEYDVDCDPDHPKTIYPKDIHKAAAAIKKDIPVTPLVRSKCCVQLGFEVNYKFEIFNRTGSFHERGALYSLQLLNEDQRRQGVVTASTGNWAKALAFRGRRLRIPVTAVLPVNTALDVVNKIKDYGAKIILHGNSFAEAKTQAFVHIHEKRCGTYINGYDHPHVIAASGSIGAEILEQLPHTDAILIPVGGGGLLAGVAIVAKKMKPSILIYGIESDKCCCFFKALVNERPYKIACGRSIAESLAAPIAGANAFHNARSLIDKMVLVNDDSITRALLHLVEEEKVVAEGAGAVSLSALMGIPNLLPELRRKTVVCIITGGNVDKYTFPIALERAMAIEGRIIKVTVTLRPEDTRTRLKVLSMIANVGASIRSSYTDVAWISENDLETIYLTLICETRDLQHACQLKRVMCRIFPNMCQFLEEPFSPIPICACYPNT